MEPVEYHRGEYTISTDPARLDAGAIHAFLTQQSYWARSRSLETVTTSLRNSLCFGVYHGEEQVGLARIVTDRATFAWLCDVYIAPAHRGQGLGKWLIECVTACPDLQNLLFLLATRDAHELYRRYGGFKALEDRGHWMRR